MKPTRFYTEVVPDAGLAPVVACYWVFAVSGDDDGGAHSIIPDGGVNVAAVQAPGAPEPFVGVVGPRITPLLIPVSRDFVYWGMRLWPGAAAALALDATGTRDLHQQGDMDSRPIKAWREAVRANATSADFFGEVAGESAPVFEAMNTALLGAGVNADLLDRPIMSVVFEILESGGRLPISDLAAAAGLSLRQMQRRFKAAVGLTPKELSRVRRMRMAAVHAVTTEGGWSNLALDSGFADQAHMIREFRDLYGLPPQGFRKAVERIEHGKYS